MPPVDADGNDDVTDAAGPSDTTDTASPHDNTLAGDPGETAVPVDTRDVIVAVGRAGACKPQAGRVNDDPIMVVGCAQTDGVTQLVGDAGDDDKVTQVTIGVERKTVPTGLPAEGGRSDATTWVVLEVMERAEIRVKSTHDTDDTHVLDVSTDKAGQDEANPSLSFNPEEASTPIYEV